MKNLFCCFLEQIQLIFNYQHGNRSGSALCREIYSIRLTMASLINNTGKSPPTAVICSGPGTSLLYSSNILSGYSFRFPCSVV